MATSTIPAFKSALVTRLAADASIVASGAVVSYGDPYPEPKQDDWIWVGSTKSAPGETTAALGMGRREERYDLTVVCCKRADARTPQQQVTERSFVLAGYVEASVRAWGGYASAAPDPFNWSTTGVRLAQVINLDHVESLGPDKRYSLVTITLEVQARI